MTKEIDHPKLSSETSVDLGSDLLEGTGVLPELPKLPEFEETKESVFDLGISENESVESKLQSAKILINEGMLEAAKKILHQILINDSENYVVAKILEEIHELELKQLFSDEREARVYGRGRSFAARKGSEQFDNEAIEATIEKLDNDLNLQLNVQPLGSPLSLFQDREELEFFAKQLDEEFASASSEERVDLGIAFLEMELFSLAIPQFEAALRSLVMGGRDIIGEISCTSLVAYSLILAGNPYEAIVRLQPLLNDIEIDKEDKLNLFYLMGRAI